MKVTRHHHIGRARQRTLRYFERTYGPFALAALRAAVAQAVEEGHLRAANRLAAIRRITNPTLRAWD